MTIEKSQRPRLTEEGQLVIESFAELSRDDMVDWIARIVRGEPERAGMDRDDLPHDFLRRTYRKLSASSRTVFGDAVLIQFDQSCLTDNPA